MKKTFTSQDKAKIVLEAIKEHDLMSVISKRHDAHPVQIGKWRKKVETGLHKVFEMDNYETDEIQRLQQKIDELHRIVGVKDEELVWLKKKSAT